MQKRVWRLKTAICVLWISRCGGGKTTNNQNDRGTDGGRQGARSKSSRTCLSQPHSTFTSPIKDTSFETQPEGCSEQNTFHRLRMNLRPWLWWEKGIRCYLKINGDIYRLCCQSLFVYVLWKYIWCSGHRGSHTGISSQSFLATDEIRE